MNINGTSSYYGSAAYQEQITRYNDAAEEAAKRREEKAAPKPKSDEYISSGNIPVPEGEIIRPIKAVADRTGNSGGFWEALQKQKAFFMNIQEAKAEFTKCGYPEDIFTSSGDARTDANIRTGFIYQRSCLDFTYESDLYAMTNAEDFTGMSDAEIYRAIYSKYQHCYGEHFLDLMAIDFQNPPDQDDDVYRNTVFSFRKEVMDACGVSEYELLELRKNALYPDMTDDEIRQSIINDYKERYGSNMTNTELCKMAQEMYDCDVDCGFRSILNFGGNMFIYGNPNYDITGIPYDHTASQAKWMNTKVSGAVFSNAYSTYQNKLMVGANVDPQLGYMINYVRSELLSNKITFYI